MTDRESIRGIVEEAGELSPEEREQLIEKLGKHFAGSFFRLEGESRIDEATRLEDFVRREGSTDPKAIGDELSTRRAELIAQGVVFSELKQFVVAARLEELRSLMRRLKDYSDMDEICVDPIYLDSICWMIENISDRMDELKREARGYGNDG